MKVQGERYFRGHNCKTYDTCIQGSPEIDLERKKLQDLGGSRIHDHHSSGVTALPVELPIPWEQGGEELGICIQVLLVPTLCLIHQDSPKGTPGMTCCHLWLSATCRCSIYA